MKNEVFKLFANCILVNGFIRSAVIDTQRNDIIYIPHDLHQIIDKFEGKEKKDVIEAYGENNAEIVNDYFEFLESNELIFWTKVPEMFTEISSEWDYPSYISNAILDFTKDSNYDFSAAITELCNDLLCGNFLLRFFDDVELREIKKVLTEFNNTKTNSIDLIFPHNNLDDKKVISLVKNNPRIRSVLLSNSKKNKVLYKSGEDSGNIITTNIKINSPFYGSYFKKDVSDMILNLRFINESINFNNFLNRKIAIDKNGNIKNSSSFDKTFGKVGEIKLFSVYNNPDFKKLWGINSDKIDVCKDCELRYNCLMYVENEKEFKPYKFCNYDPYKAKWI